ncbi:hypothetical protein [Clostridium sp. CCUG 7971]|uniref:hypothetical protein n=1 Tax=Clostridium sp. CCUG 7971 TaxID=2811414 RepID=UPI001ABAB20E|nr:hypothetical protein [Clostridium sp. CCUG 7971]MBO3444166.1 hypothetical protein [Clostridium sp. CCUG 7971]
MFISLENIKSEKLIDVRSEEEHKVMPLCQYNVPVISKKEHNILKKNIYFAIPIILCGLIKNRSVIEKHLITISDNKTKKVVIGCSQGRLRSPIVCIYARVLGIKSYVLKNGIKQYYVHRERGIKSWFKL